MDKKLKIVLTSVPVLATAFFVAMKLKNKYDVLTKETFEETKARAYDNPPLRCTLFGWHAVSKINNRCVNCGKYC